VGLITFTPIPALPFKHLADELRALVKREAEAQTTEIDRALKALGVSRDWFEAAAPEVVRVAVRRAV
jgi:hypothetical protein